jgi:hypothetical protein
VDGPQRAGSRADSVGSNPGRPLSSSRLRAAALAAWLLAAAPILAADRVSTKSPLRILFIGNSLTYANDLPALVAALAEGAGEPAPVWDAVVEGGFSLEDHWSRGAAQKAISRAGWDFVVLQQGPSALPESRLALTRDAIRFADLVAKAGGRTALYMVWPSRSRSFDFQGVVDSYRTAADRAGALLLPAGEAWRIAAKSAPEIALYSPDGLHPTVEGSYLAAVVIAARLYRRSPVGLPSLGLPEAKARPLQQAAAAACGNDATVERSR